MRACVGLETRLVMQPIIRSVESPLDYSASCEGCPRLIASLSRLCKSPFKLGTVLKIVTKSWRRVNETSD